MDNINSITKILSKTKNQEEFNYLIVEHEKLISNVINKTPIKKFKIL